MAWKHKAKFKSESFPTLQLSTLPTATEVLATIIWEQDDTGLDTASPPQCTQVLVLVWEHSTTEREINWQTNIG